MIQNLQLDPFIAPQIITEKLSGLTMATGIEISILRLDLLHEVVSGNKWLKLQGWLEMATAAQRNGIMTAGGPWSNHIHAAAAYCYLQQMPFNAIIKGKNETLTPMLQDVLAWNGKITWVNHSEFAHEKKWQQIAANTNMQWVPMGGDGAEGETGVKKFFDQFTIYEYDELWCAMGTGTTLAGIASSNIGAHQIIGFDPGIGDKKVYEKIQSLEEKVPYRKIEMRKTGSDKFGRITPEILQSMNLFYECTGVPTEVVYTGKMVHELMKDLLLPINCEKKSILIVHTGGLQGNRSLPEGSLKFMG